jgi:hypothetical protein
MHVKNYLHADCPQEQSAEDKVVGHGVDLHGAKAVAQMQPDEFQRRHNKECIVLER